MVIWQIHGTTSIAGHSPQVLGAPRAVLEDGRHAVRFNGVSDGLIVPNNPVQGRAAFTVEVLFKPDGDGPTEQRFVHFEDTGRNRGLIETRVTRDRRWYLDTYLHVGATDKGVTLVDKEKLHPCDRWYWAALVYDGRVMSHFVNGVKEKEGAIAFGPMTEGRTSIGVRLNEVFWFKGAIAELRFHPRAIDAAELQRPAASVSAAGGFEWQSVTPASRGLSAAKLEALRDELAQRGTKALLLVRDDGIVHEWYSSDHAATKPHYTASMAKAIVGGVSVAVALNDGRLSLDEPVAARFVPQWRSDPAKSRITLRQLGSHTSGLEDAEAGDLPHDKLPGWKGEFWKRRPRDPFTLSRDVAPLIAAPGTEIHYSNPGIAMMDYATTVALRDAPQRDLRTLLRERVMRPIGVPDGEWSVGYGQTVEVDGLPLVSSWGGGGYTARATARVGRLMLREGNWEGRQLIKPEAVRAVTCDAGTPGTCGIGWWSNNEGAVPSMPRDAFWGAGAQHQTLLVIPSLKLIAVRNGGALSKGDDYNTARNKYFFEPLMKALAPE